MIPEPHLGDMPFDKLDFYLPTLGSRLHAWFEEIVRLMKIHQCTVPSSDVIYSLYHKVMNVGRKRVTFENLGEELEAFIAELERCMDAVPIRSMIVEWLEEGIPPESTWRAIAYKAVETGVIFSLALLMSTLKQGIHTAEGRVLTLRFKKLVDRHGLGGSVEFLVNGCTVQVRMDVDECQDWLRFMESRLR
jgi:hypothetical protein